MQQFRDYARTVRNGVVVLVPQPTVAVYLAGTDTLATIYSDNDGTPLTNPFQGDAAGLFAFYAPNGRYKVVVSKSGSSDVTPDVMLIDLGDPLGAEAVGAQLDEPDAQPTNLLIIVREAEVKLERFADPKGPADAGEGNLAVDTACWGKAMATGKRIKCRNNRTYLGSAARTFTSSRQRIDLNGSIYRPSGELTVFATSGSGYDNAIVGGVLDGPLLTGSSTWFNCNGPNNLLLEDLQVFGGRNLLDIRSTNNVSVKTVWASDLKGDFMIRWRGTDAAPANVLHLADVKMSGNVLSRPDGIVWEGLAHSLNIQSCSIVFARRGLVARSLAGVTGVPEFGQLDNLEVDFPYEDGIRLEAGQKFALSPLTYSNGSSVGSGLYVGPGVAPDAVIVSGGQYTGNARYGIENAVSVIRDSMQYMAYNTLGNVSGDMRALAIARMNLDANAGFYLAGGSPVYLFDAGDYVQFDRGADTLNVVMGSQNKMVVSKAGRFALPGLIARNFADDAAAATGGVLVGDWYHNNGAPRIRIS